MTTVELSVTGMHCASCVALIEETLVGLPGVSSADVDLEAGVATVACDKDGSTVEQLCAAVVAEGYGASLREGPGLGS